MQTNQKQDAYLTHKGRAAIPDTGVLADLAPGTHFTRVELKPGKQFCLVFKLIDYNLNKLE